MRGERPATLVAMQDALLFGDGFVRIQRITTEQYRVTRVHPADVVLVDGLSYLDRELLDAILAAPCSYCQAGPGDRCRTSSGGRSTTFHSARSAPAFEAYRVGFAGGLVDAVRRLTLDWDTPADELLDRHGLR